MPRAPRYLLGLLLASPLNAACATGNDDPGAGGSGAAPSSSSTSVGGAGGAGGGELPAEPDGAPKITIVNGVNDYESIRLCFSPWPDGGDAAPYPAAGLPFAAASVMDPKSLPAGVDILIHVLAGDLTKAAGKKCAELTNGAPLAGLVVTPLAVLPASAIAAPRSLLLVPKGCLGGAGHTGALEKEACGEDYAPDAPTPGLVAAGMSRLVEKNSISMQFAQAAVAPPEIDVRVVPGIPGANPFQAAPSLTPGEVGPFPPFQSLSSAEMGTLSDAAIQTFPPIETVPSSTFSLATALERGGLGLTDFGDASGYTFVAVGAMPGIPAGAFWHALTWTAVRADP